MSQPQPFPQPPPLITPEQKLQKEREQELKDLDDGRLFSRLVYLRQHARYIAPSEMYLALNPAEVQNTATVHFSHARGLEYWRNILVLVPLFLTWFGLYLAAGEYAQTISTNPKALNTPFLKLWVDGFPLVHGITIFHFFQVPENFLHFFSFSHVAEGDVLLFILLIMFTFIIQGNEAGAARKALGLANWLRGELFQMQCESVTVHQQGSDREIALNRLSDLLADMRNVVSTFEGASQRQAQGLDELLKGTIRVAQTIDGIEEIFQRGRETYDKLDQALPRLGSQFDSMTTSQGKVSDTLQRIADGVEASAQSVQELARPFVAAGTRSMAQKVATQHQQMINDNEQVLAKNAEITRRIGEIAQHIQTIQPLPRKKGFWRRLLPGK